MICLLLSFLLISKGASLEYKLENHPRPLIREVVVVLDSGDTYVLNPWRGAIEHFGPNGSKLGEISQWGYEAGDLYKPSLLFYKNEELYVFDHGLNNISVFDLEGNYSRRIYLETFGYVMAIAPTGWVYGDWRYARNPKDPARLFWVDENFENPKPLLTWKRRQTDATKFPLPVNPADDRVHMASTFDGKWVFLCQPGAIKISVIDAARGEIVRTIARDDKPVPFNKEWGQKMIEYTRRNLDMRGLQRMEIAPDFPEFFPRVIRLYSAAGNKIVVEKWTSDPDNRRDYLIMDMKGRDSELGYLPQNEKRILAVRNHRAYLGMFRDGNAFIAVYPLSEIDRVAREHPIPIDAYIDDKVGVDVSASGWRWN